MSFLSTLQRYKKYKYGIMYWYQTSFCYLHCNSPLKMIVKFFSRYRSPCPPYHLLQTNSTKQTTPAEGLIKWSFGKNCFNISSNVYYKKYWPCHKMCMKTEKKTKKVHLNLQSKFNFMRMCHGVFQCNFILWDFSSKMPKYFLHKIGIKNSHTIRLVSIFPQ
mgnify:CR=1 FL=1